MKSGILADQESDKKEKEVTICPHESARDHAAKQCQGLSRAEDIAATSLDAVFVCLQDITREMIRKAMPGIAKNYNETELCELRDQGYRVHVPKALTWAHQVWLSLIVMLIKFKNEWAGLVVFGCHADEV